MGRMDHHASGRYTSVIYCDIRLSLLTFNFLTIITLNHSTNNNLNPITHLTPHRRDQCHQKSSVSATRKVVWENNNRSQHVGRSGTCKQKRPAHRHGPAGQRNNQPAAPGFRT